MNFVDKSKTEAYFRFTAHLPQHRRHHLKAREIPLDCTYIFSTPGFKLDVETKRRVNKHHFLLNLNHGDRHNLFLSHCPKRTRTKTSVFARL